VRGLVIVLAIIALGFLVCLGLLTFFEMAAG
jgi:hypothetical protein